MIDDRRLRTLARKMVYLDAEAHRAEQLGDARRQHKYETRRERLAIERFFRLRGREWHP